MVLRLVPSHAILLHLDWCLILLLSIVHLPLCWLNRSLMLILLYSSNLYSMKRILTVRPFVYKIENVFLSRRLILPWLILNRWFFIMIRISWYLLLYLLVAFYVLNICILILILLLVGRRVSIFRSVWTISSLHFYFLATIINLYIWSIMIQIFQIVRGKF